MTADSSTELLTALHTRREYCKALLHLAEEQQLLVDADRMTDLIQLMAKQERVIELLNSIEQTRGGLSEWWKSIRDEVPPTTRRHCEAVVTETKALMDSILARNQRGLEVLTEHCEETRGELMELNEVLQQRRMDAHHAPKSHLLDEWR